MLTLARQRVHVTRANGQADSCFSLAADTLHVRAEKGVGAGQADHDDRGALRPAGDKGADGLGNLRQVAARDDVRLIEGEVGEALAVMARA